METINFAQKVSSKLCAKFLQQLLLVNVTVSIIFCCVKFLFHNQKNIFETMTSNQEIFCYLSARRLFI